MVGIAGLRWHDVSERTTPALWRLTGQGSVASLVTRTTTATTCPETGWLTISAGQRATGDCLPPPEGTDPLKPGSWAAIKKANQKTSYAAQVGLLGDAVHSAGGCTTAVGPGAAYGAADGLGRVDHYFPKIEALGPADWSSCELTTVSAENDADIGKILAAVPAGTRVIVAGISDTGSRAHIHAVLDTARPGGYLKASSTRRTGLVTLTDLTATVLRELGRNQPLKAVGSAWRPEASSAAPATKVETLDDQDVTAQTIADVDTPLILGLFAIELLLYGLYGLYGYGLAARKINRVAALAVAAVPAATYLAQLIPWWRVSPQALGLVGSVLGCAAAITVLSLAGPWRRTVTGPSLVVAGVSALVLGLDALTGSHLQLNAVLGYRVPVGGRFYGFGNIAFAVFATGALLSAGWLAERPLRAGRTALAVTVATVIGLAAVALDGSPAWGADFGGVPAIVVGTAVLAAMLAGRRLSVFRLGVFCLAGLAVVLAFAFADSLRPVPQQTHLGKFWEQLQSGEAFGIIARKLGAMLASLAYWPYTLITVAALCTLWFVLVRRGLLARVYAWSPATRPALAATLTMVALSTVMNDSGVEIPALAFTLLVPLLLAAAEGIPRTGGADTAAPAPPESRSAARG